MIPIGITQTTGSLRAARFCLCLALLLVASAGRGQSAQPEVGSGFTARPAAAGTRFMAVTANPLATDAAVEILHRGGSAIDAAIAAQWVLNLVEPQSSGIGGGGFLLHWDAASRKVSAWDGRETAPRSISEDFGRHADGSPLPFAEILASGKAVGVPGLLAMLEAAHRKHGKIAWQHLLSSAIRLAEKGFPISPRLHLLLRDDPLLRKDAKAFALYYESNGKPRAVGSLLANPELAAMLRRIAAEGSVTLSRGEMAGRIAAAVEVRGGRLGLDELADYRPREREVVCAPYRRWRICGMPPPSSGGIAVLQILGILEASGRASADPERPEAIHDFAEAGRLAYADRSRYIADPDFVTVPQRELLAPAYLQQRARLLDPEKAMDAAQPGELASIGTLADGDSPELPATTHLSVVDAEGNAVALTSSIESAFGSRIQVDGFLLNNQLTDFSLNPSPAGKTVANRAEPGKRPMSSMSPTLVFDDEDSLHAVLGSPGGSRIINYVARTLVAVLDHGMEPAAALSLGHVGNRNGATELEKGRVAPGLARELERRGHAVQMLDMTSGLHLILRREGRWVGAADPRREGSARGE